MDITGIVERFDLAELAIAVENVCPEGYFPEGSREDTFQELAMSIAELLAGER